jgi:hypothetical protein
VRIRRMTGLLFAGALTVAGLSASMGAVAQAGTATAAVTPNVVPAPATPYEIFPPFINPRSPKCIDVPSASTRAGVALQIFHCKSSSNQLWQFFLQPGTSDIYQIQNLNSHLCLAIETSTASDGELVTQNACDAIPAEEWHVSSPIEGDNFNMINVDFPSECMAAANNSGADHTPVVIQTCNPGNIFAQNQLQTWQL